MLFHSITYSRDVDHINHLFTMETVVRLIKLYINFFSNHLDIEEIMKYRIPENLFYA